MFAHFSPRLQSKNHCSRYAFFIQPLSHEIDRETLPRLSIPSLKSFPKPPTNIPGKLVIHTPDTLIFPLFGGTI